jgi:hypothetical protein
MTPLRAAMSKNDLGPPAVPNDPTDIGVPSLAEQRAYRCEQRHTALLAALDALVADMREVIDPKHAVVTYWADRLAAALATHREPQ